MQMDQAAELASRQYNFLHTASPSVQSQAEDADTSDKAIIAPLVHLQQSLFKRTWLVLRYVSSDTRLHASNKVRH